MKLYNSKLDRIRTHQEKFVNKMLSYSLDYGHVLYCMNNETKTPVEWGRYWIQFISTAATEKGVDIYTTDMFDDGYQGENAKLNPIIFDNPGTYKFADISQVNSRNFGYQHWEVMQWVVGQVSRHPRPANHTKIYGGAYHGFGTGGLEDGVERFWRNLVGGCAAVRFHRRPGGNGLNERAQASIRAVRLAESKIKFWEVEPHMELLIAGEPNHAYVAAQPGEKYIVYFPNGGPCQLDLTMVSGVFDMKWISITEGTWVKQSISQLEGGSVVRFGSQLDQEAAKETDGLYYTGGWIAVITQL